VTVPNHDWARIIAEPTTETIDHALQQTVRVPRDSITKVRFDGEAFVAKLTAAQTAAIHMLIRQAIAAELEKLVHSYNTRPGGLVSPANVAYHIAERAEKIRSWMPTWCVVTTYDEGSEDEQPFEFLNDAILDAGLTLPGLNKKMRMR
jgi:hypothetical protein